MPRIITGLSSNGWDNLLQFIQAELRPDYDPERYRDGMMARGVFTDRAVHLEIPASDTRTGEPATVTYDWEHQLEFAEVDEDGKKIEPTPRSTR